MFSKREEDIIKVIGRKKITLQLIAEDLFADDPYKPFDAEISVGNSVRRIIAKCKHHGLNWTLIKDRRNGKLLISRSML